MTTTERTQLPSKFITAYFVAGYPTKETSIDIITKAAQSGLDAVEIGFPSKNPYLDGDTIQQAHLKAQNNFTSLDDFITYVAALRKKISIPIWIMGYSEELLTDRTYIKLAQSSYIDGFVIPNLQIPQIAEVQQNMYQENVKFIPVINNKMTDDDILTLTQDNDVIYCQLYAGKTGNKFTNIEALPDFYNRMRSLTEAKLMAGFGIKNDAIAEQIFNVGYDGLVVGSEIVRLVASDNQSGLYHLVHELVKSKKKWG